MVDLGLGRGLLAMTHFSLCLIDKVADTLLVVGITTPKSIVPIMCQEDKDGVCLL